MLDTVKKYESVAKRRNMISDPMAHWLHKLAQSQKDDTCHAAIVDWVKLGRYTGFRSSEWCQTKMNTFARITDLEGQPTQAMILTDFVFLDKNERVLTIKHRSFDASAVAFVRICWRYQKNAQNGETITFARDDTHPSFCPVRAALRIALRAIRLGVSHDTPLGVYRDATGKRRFITDSQTATLLRRAAAATFGLRPNDPALALWSTHSIRVTAANLLHRQQFSDSYIQKRLRWQSNTFLMYLRNTIYGAKQHKLRLDISDSNLPPRDQRDTRAAEPHELLLNVAAAAA